MAPTPVGLPTEPFMMPVHSSMLPTT
jgi:hypothetical protein